jgi:hypothetical protein
MTDSKNEVDTCIASENMKETKKNNKWSHYRTVWLASATAGIGIGVAGKETAVAKMKAIFYVADGILTGVLLFLY